MKIATLLLLGIWLHTASNAQQFFNKRLTLHSADATLSSVIEQDGKYYCTGLCIDSINYDPGTGVFYTAYGVKFVIFDSTGAILKDTVYQEFPTRNLLAFYNTLQAMPDKSFELALTNDNDSIGFYMMMLLRFDTLGNMIERHEYHEPFCSDSFLYNIMDLKPTGTGEWLTLASIACHQGSQFPQNTLLTKLDRNFNIIWEKQFGDLGFDHIPGKLVVDKDGYLLACGQNNFDISNSSLYCQAYLIRTDTSGNKLWDWYNDPNKKTEQPQDVVRSLDGGYIYCGGGDGLEYYAGSGYTDIVFRGWVEKVDSSGHPVWSKSFNKPWWYSTLNVIKQLANGNLVLFGEKWIPDLADSLNQHSRGWFLMLDANGDSLLERTYSGINSCRDHNIFYDAKPTTDGGFIMVGESTDQCRGYIEPIQRGWIVKVDSNGCLGPNDPQCQPLNVNQPGVINNVFVYPNPAYDVVHVRTGTATGEMQAILSDISGRELKSKALRQGTLTDIELKGLPPGLYLLKVLQPDGAVKTYKVSHY